MINPEKRFLPCDFWQKRRCCWPWSALGDAGAVPLVTRSCTNVSDQKERNIWGLLGGRNRLLPCGKGRLASPGSGSAASKEG